MADGDSQGPDAVKIVAQLAALLVAVVALLYAAGGGVLALRLFFEDLPSLTIVGQLPREFLISIALTQIVLPAFVVAALYDALRLLRGASPPKRLLYDWSGSSWRDRGKLLAAAAVPAVGATLLGAGLAVAKEGATRQLVWLVVAFASSLLVMLVALSLRVKVVRRYEGSWRAWRPVALMASIVALGSLPIWVIVAGTFHLLDAKVCTTTHSQETGVLIGETSDRIYIGEARSEGPRRVASIPLAQVEEVFIGGQAASRKCSYER